MKIDLTNFYLSIDLLKLRRIIKDASLRKLIKGAFKLLGEHEKKEKRKIYNRTYRERLKKRAIAGDEKAQKQLKKSNRGAAFAATKSYVRRHATMLEINELQDVIAKRIKTINKKN